MYKTFPCKLQVTFVIVRWNLNINDRIPEKYSDIKFHKNPSSGRREVTRGMSGGRSWSYMVALRNPAARRLKSSAHYRIQSNTLAFAAAKYTVCWPPYRQQGNGTVNTGTQAQRALWIWRLAYINTGVSSVQPIFHLTLPPRSSTSSSDEACATQSSDEACALSACSSYINDK